MTAQVLIQQVLLKRGNTAVASAYVGPIGEVVVDTDLHTLRVQDASEPGGYLVATKAFVDAQVNVITAGISDLVGNLIANTIPASDRLVSGEYEIVLGSDGVLALLSGSNIYDNGGALRFDANKNIQLSAYDNGTPSTWTFGTNGTLTFPGDATITNPADTLVTTGLRINITGSVYNAGTGGIELQLADPAIGELISANPSFYSFRFASGAALGITLPGAFVAVGTPAPGSTWRSEGWGIDTPNISSAFSLFSSDYVDPYTAPGYLQLSSGTAEWTFGTDGRLTLPSQGKIGPTDVNSFLTFNWGDDVELKAGDNLYLSGSVATIRTNSNANQWIFGQNGTTTFPSNTITQSIDNTLSIATSTTEMGIGVQLNTGGSGYPVGSFTNVTTTVYTGEPQISTGTGLTVDIVVTEGGDPGTGYVTSVTLNSPGINYLPGDFLSVDTGDDNCIILITETESLTTHTWNFATDGNLTLPTDGTISYTPANPGDWNSPPPTTIHAALDRLAAFSPGA